MTLLEKLHSLALLTPEQFQELSAWEASPLTWAQCQDLMPLSLLETFEMAVTLLELDEDLATMH